MKPRAPGLAAVVAASLVAGGATLGMLRHGGHATTPSPGQSGLDFKLTGPNGQEYSRASFPAGSVLVMYFGYTTCWQRCPATLNTIAEAVESLGSRGRNIYPIFVSFDPQRETQEMVQTWLQGFGTRFTGLIGPRAAVWDTASRFGVWIQVKRFSDRPDDYEMGHNSPILVWCPGEPTPRRLPATTTAHDLAQALLASHRES